MKPLIIAVLQAGLVASGTLSQFQRWGLVPRAFELEVLDDVVLILESIRYAQEVHAQTSIQSTELDILRFYLTQENQRRGRLTVVDGETGAQADKEISYAIRTQFKKVQYIIPWTSDSITDILTNGCSYLAEDTSTRVYFSDIEEVYLGDSKVFLICKGERVHEPA